MDHLDPAERFFHQLLQDEEEEKNAAVLPSEVTDEEPPTKPVTPHNLFRHHDTHPVILDTALLKLFGTEWFEWEPATLWEELKRRLPAGGPSELNRNKIQAVKTLHMNNFPWETWEVFVPIALALNNVVPIFTMIHKLSVPQVMAAVNTIRQIRDEEYDPEVRRYLAACFLDEGVVYAPPPVSFIQMDISQPHYRCLDCGNEDQDDLVDGVCDVCSERFTDDKPLDLKPNPDLVPRIKEGEGRRLERFYKYPFEEVEKAYNAVKGQPTESLSLPETRVGVQVMKLLVARDYIALRTAQLSDQAKVLQTWLETR